MTKVSVLILILIIVTVAAAGVLAYTSTLQRSAQQPAHVTWLDKNGDSITSILLTSSSQAYRSDTVFFTCSSPIGTISLQLSSNIGAVVRLSNSTYTSCSNSANSLILSISPTSSLTATGTLQVTQSDIYRILPGQLAINVQVS